MLKKSLLYFIIPIVVFVLILLNAFFGHLIFENPVNKDINKYSIYIHLQDNWQSFQKNIVFEVTNVWKHTSMTGTKIIYSDSGEEPRNYNQLQYQNGKSYVELQHEYSDCTTSWKPILYKYALDSIQASIEKAQGTTLTSNPYERVYPNLRPSIYVQEIDNKPSFTQFIPICTTKNFTSYTYSVKVNDSRIGFDVFFVKPLHEDSPSTKFEYYADDGCSGKNFSSFNGKCKVEKGSGLLIVVPDSLNRSLTKFSVSLIEEQD